ncbi:MAG: CHAD domain-containing protein [Rhodocyclaceae bacterium]|nr:CHAD domain-containing protein [Rhodocyclaceae bacterium]
MSTEVELKLSLPPSALAALKRHPIVRAAVREGRAQALANTYFDTPEMVLSARRIALRTRRQGRRWLQTVKGYRASTGGLSSRPEWEQPYLGAFDFSQVDDDDTRTALEDTADDLTPLFTTDFRRDTRRITPSDGVEVLLMIDQGEIRSGDQVEPICEVELELVHGRAQDLYDLAGALAQSLPLRPEDDSKAERGLRLYRGEVRRPVRASASPVLPEQSPLEAFRLIALACLAQWQRNASAAANDASPEFIHQMRVGLRRLRSAVKLFGPTLPAEWVTHWSGELAAAADELGEARDIDVLHGELLEPILTDESCPDSVRRLAEHVIAARDAARRQVRARLDGPGQGRRMIGVAAEIAALRGNPLDASADITTFARLQLTALRKQSRKRWSKARDGVPEAVHDLRISLKRLRYAIEFFEPLFPPGRVRRFRKTMAVAQEDLGYLNDIEVGNQRLAGWAEGDPELEQGAAFVAGWHGALGRKVRRRILPETGELLEAAPPWGKGR